MLFGEFFTHSSRLDKTQQREKERKECRKIRNEHLCVPNEYHQSVQLNVTESLMILRFFNFNFDFFEGAIFPLSHHFEVSRIHRLSSIVFIGAHSSTRKSLSHGNQSLLECNRIVRTRQLSTRDCAKNSTLLHCFSAAKMLNMKNNIVITLDNCYNR